MRHAVYNQKRKHIKPSKIAHEFVNAKSLDNKTARFYRNKNHFKIKSCLPSTKSLQSKLE